jgi:hypothetical protein
MARNYVKIEKDIAETGFFSEYLPPCFSLDKKALSRSPDEKCDLIPPYSFTMSRYNGNDARRTIFIPEIGSYTVARNFIRQNEIIKELIEFIEQGDSSFSHILAEDDSIVRHEQAYDDTVLSDEDSSAYIENIALKIIRASGAIKILKLDISNCFSSFYLHMMPTIIMGLENAESNYLKLRNNPSDTSLDEVYLKYFKLDKILRRQNSNRTNGLLVGPLMSKIVIEAFLSRIDMDLQNASIRFSRYIDDYEVYLYDDNDKSVISVFTNILKRYSLSLNNEKTEVIDFPYYLADNLEKIFGNIYIDEMNDTQLMELFNTFSNLEKGGTKGALRFLLKSLEKKVINVQNPELLKAYLLTIIKNNERSLIKACSRLIKNNGELQITETDLRFFKTEIRSHITAENDLEALWLVYSLIELAGLPTDSDITDMIAESNNELLQILLLRKGLLNPAQLSGICTKASSWILLYELYAGEHIKEDVFVSRLGLNKNTEMYRFLKNHGVHFCK